MSYRRGELGLMLGLCPGEIHRSDGLVICWISPPKAKDKEMTPVDGDGCVGGEEESSVSHGKFMQNLWIELEGHMLQIHTPRLHTREDATTTIEGNGALEGVDGTGGE